MVVAADLHLPPVTCALHGILYAMDATMSIEDTTRLCIWVQARPPTAPKAKPRPMSPAEKRSALAAKLEQAGRGEAFTQQAMARARSQALEEAEAELQVLWPSP